MHKDSKVILFSISFALWLFTVYTHRLTTLNIRQTPFMELGILFYIGLALSFTLFIKIHSIRGKFLVLILLYAYSTVTLVIIEDFGRMHDSALNVFSSIGENKWLQSNYSNYATSWPGFFYFVRIFLDITGFNPWLLIRFFPVMCAPVYIFLAYAGCRRIVKALGYNAQEAREIGLWFIYFIVIFGQTFAIRNNAAAQTYSYLLFFSTLYFALIRTRKENILFVITAISMIISHALSLLLGLPGLLIVNLAYAKRLKRSLYTILILPVLYFAWVMHISGATLLGLVSVATGIWEVAYRERALAIVGGYLEETLHFITINRIYIALLLLTLIICFLSVKREKIRNSMLKWGILLSPFLGMLLFYPYLFDRVLLFSIVPVALIFSTGIHQRLQLGGFSHHKRNILIILLIVTTVLSIYRSYFEDNTSDRITHSEFQAQGFVYEKIKTGMIFMDGYNLPFDFKVHTLGSYRGETPVNLILRCNYLLITQQMIYSTMLHENTIYELTYLGLLEKNFTNSCNRIYNNGWCRIYSNT